MGFAGDITVYPEWTLNPLNTPTPSIFGIGINSEYVTIAIFLICIFGMITVFVLAHSNNVPWAFAIGLMLAVVMCNVWSIPLNYLGIMIYPIDILTGLIILGIVFISRH
jgi:hypothetical protein